MKEKIAPISDKKREDLKDKLNITWDALFYSHQRMDLLIITISGAGLYVILEATKYFLEQNQPIPFVLKLSSVLFVISIIVNFLSQFYSAKAHENNFCGTLLELEENRTEDQDTAFKYYKEQEKVHDKTTKALNISSMWLMFAGLTALTVTLFFIF